MLSFKNLLLLMVFLLLIFFASSGIVIKNFFQESLPPTPAFGFQDQGAVYTIVRNENGLYAVHYHNSKRFVAITNIRIPFTNTYFAFERDPKQYSFELSQNPVAPHEYDAQILVGNSTPELSTFVNSDVHLDAKFRPTFAEQQCISTSCQAFGTKSVVIDINSVEN